MWQQFSNPELLNVLNSKAVSKHDKHRLKDAFQKEVPTSVYLANRRALAVGKGIIAAALPIDIIWVVLGLLVTGMLASIFSLALIGVLGVGLGLSIYFIKNKKLKKSDDAQQGELNLKKIKIEICDELKERQKKELIKKTREFLELSIQLAAVQNNEIPVSFLLGKPIKDYTDEELLEFAVNSEKQTQLIRIFDPNYIPSSFFPKMSEVKLAHDVNQKEKIPKSLYKRIVSNNTVNAAVAGITLTSTLFVGFYWCGTSALTAFGATAVAAALMTPVGLIIGLLLSLIIGGLYFYLNYKHACSTKSVEKKITQYDEILQSKIAEVNYLENAKEHLQQAENEIIKIKAFHNANMSYNNDEDKSVKFLRSQTKHQFSHCKQRFFKRHRAPQLVLQNATQGFTDGVKRDLICVV